MSAPIRENSILPHVMLAFSILMLIVYTCVGIFMIGFGYMYFPNLSQTVRTILGALIILYGVFRLWRVVKMYKANSQV